MVEYLMMRICANRTTWSGDTFVEALQNLVDLVRREPPTEPAKEEPRPPPRNKDEAMERYRERQAQTPEVPTPPAPKYAPPDPNRQGQGNAGFTPSGRRRITDKDKEEIRKRYKLAKAGAPRIERGWVKRIAKEYDVSESLIFNIVYTDPAHEAVPRGLG